MRTERCRVYVCVRRVNILPTMRPHSEKMTVVRLDYDCQPVNMSYRDARMHLVDLVNLLCDYLLTNIDFPFL